jgi:PHD/YefM family antitoxin component YafN of YafNO toxin-antitoxin module
MYTIHLNDLPQTMQTLIQQVINDHEPIRISSPSLPENVVLVSELDYDGLTETLNLLSHPTEADRLRQARAEPLEQAIPWSVAKKVLGL